MADFSTNIPQLSTSQANKEKTVNGIADAASLGTYFGRDYSNSSGLTWAYLGGVVLVDGTPTRIANGTLTLTNTATNYIEATRAGVVSSNTSGFTAGRVPLYQVTASGGVVTTWLDVRYWATPKGRLSKSVAGNTDVTLSAIEARCDIMEFTGALTGNINVIVPVGPVDFIVYNNTSGAFTLTVKTSAGTGIAVTQAVRYLLYSDGTNVVKVADSSGGGASAANPTASVGLSTVNGSAATFLRSDGAPPLSQAITPTWTNSHTFTASTILQALLDISNASAGQIKFPSSPNASANANTIDDYSEGTTTPVTASSIGTITTQSTTVHYTKTGRRVSFDATIVITNNGTGAGFLFFTLPYTNNGLAAGFSGINQATANLNAAFVSAGGTACSVFKYDGTYPVASGQAITVSGSYDN